MIMKKWTAAVLAVILLLTLGLSCFGEKAPEPAPEKTAFKIETEEQLIAASGMTVHDWDSQAAALKSIGLKTALTEAQLTERAPDAAIARQNGVIWKISGAGKTMDAILTPLDAYRAAYSLTALLGCDDTVQLRLWSRLSASGTQIYVFQQVCEGVTAVASTLRLVTDRDGRVTTIISSLSPSSPAANGGIRAEEAEHIVEAYIAEHQWKADILSKYTVRAVIPPPIDDESDEVLPDRLVWIVYTQNPQFRVDRSVDLPYLAHCVGMDGEYMRHVGVTMPGDPAAQGAHPAVYTFDFMESASYTGEIMDVNNQPQTVTVPVMRDSRTGTWYLGDPVRRIAVADYQAFVYGEQRVQLISREANEGWDDEDLITYLNMIRAWDFYDDIGWKGPDGIGTPLLLLSGMCTEEGKPIFNAAYLGMSQGWQCFGYGRDTQLGQGLDVMAHEFTHCVTGTVMNTNLYQDDQGAINEAMSDILGNLCEYVYGATADASWNLGENTGMVLRCMLKPHDHDQPEYVWDTFYAPHAGQPNDGNDRGGVHINSSLLNLVAARLCAEHGMPLENARSFWMTVAFLMTPRTDYPQLAALLPEALRLSGNEAYQDALKQLIADTRMTETDLPEALPEGQQTVTLTLPDTEAFQDHRWSLIAMQLDTRELASRWQAVTGYLRSLFDPNADAAQMLNELKQTLHIENVRSLDDLENMSENQLTSLVSSMASGVVSQHLSWKSIQGNDVTMVVYQQPTLFLLGHVNDDGTDYDKMAVLIGDEWFDLSDPDGADEAAMERMAQKVIDVIVNHFTADRGTAPSPILPDAGLERIQLPAGEPEQDMAEGDESAESPEITEAPDGM